MTDARPPGLPELADLFDAHVHTEFAYCAEDITVEGALERAAALGLGSLGLCEHADQLYLPREGFWKRTDTNDRRSLRKAAKEGHSRVAAYRRRVTPFRSGRVFLGLEAEPDISGRGLAILDGDADGYDYLIGSVHEVAARDEDIPQAEAVRRFIRFTEQLVESGVQVLGHPFRYFTRRKRPVPRELFAPVAEMLAARGVAAEINFHTDNPPAEFFAACVERGAKLAVGSDSHALAEVGDLGAHIALLKEIGAWERRADVLWRPRRGAGIRASG